jgi:hypothetical protein
MRHFLLILYGLLFGMYGGNVRGMVAWVSGIGKYQGCCIPNKCTIQVRSPGPVRYQVNPNRAYIPNKT